MVLNIKKSTSVTGQVEMEGTVVVYLSASVSTDPNSNTSISQSIQNPELYAQNKAECRREIQAFQEYVYEVEDAELTAAGEGA